MADPKPKKKRQPKPGPVKKPRRLSQRQAQADRDAAIQDRLAEQNPLVRAIGAGLLGAGPRSETVSIRWHKDLHQFDGGLLPVDSPAGRPKKKRKRNNPFKL